MILISQCKIILLLQENKDENDSPGISSDIYIIDSQGSITNAQQVSDVSDSDIISTVGEASMNEDNIERPADLILVQSGLKETYIALLKSSKVL